ncbi:DUF885 domain-containing protein [Paraflavisolibacter sp. H34]|uniref:DUF885 domain-containing protein n=1 Tax=Huijunlia imazamoxiresistens TaxID=3127457 RepID=UPI00301AA821
MMKPLLVFLLIGFTFSTARLQAPSPSGNDSQQLAALVNSYYEEGLRLFPLDATENGDYRYNDLLFADFTDSYRATLKEFYYHYLFALKDVKRENLGSSDRISYDLLKKELDIKLEGLAFKYNRMPADQFSHSLPLVLAQFGSGDVVQPFKTIKDYDNWIRRATAFSAWTDSALAYFRKGMAENIVLPRALVAKMIPQLEALVANAPTQSVFYGPIRKLPQAFPEEEKKRLTEAYVRLINGHLNSAYRRLANFLKTEYLPVTRTTSGWGALPGGNKMYQYRIRQQTTTNTSADALFQTGLAEVKRIRAEMEKVKAQIGFRGSLDSLFRYMTTDARFFPYKTPEEVLNAYRALQQKIEPSLAKMFTQTPKTPFVIKQTEAFRAASAAAEYYPGSLENNRPAIFYVPIVDVTKTELDESVFLHEAIPGHHYQLSLQYENERLPKFRRYGGTGAYVEGWALYAESLGKELGVYTDPYQYLRALGSEIHRAIRLVTDAGLHAKGWTREQAIQYMRENEPISEQFATAEIERYMAWPGQALTYKVGELKIKELRNRYSRQLGARFRLSAFHDELLKDGALPLDLLEQKMNAWAMKQ